MNPHWPTPLVVWILTIWSGLIAVGVAVWWWLCRPTREARAAEDAAVVLPPRAGVSSMYDPGREIRP